MAKFKVKVTSTILSVFLFTNIFISPINSNKTHNLANALKWLKVGEPPNILSQRDLKDPNHHLNVDKTSAFGNGPFNKFEIQYTFIRNGTLNSDEIPVGSFEYLSNDTSLAKKYLVEMNLKIHGGNILPSKRLTDEEWTNLHEWLDLMSKGEKGIILVDSDAQTLFKDVNTSDTNSVLYTTRHEHRFTLIKFRHNGTDVIAEAQKSDGTLVILLDQNGKLERVKKSSSLSSESPPVEIARFTEDELKQIAVITEEIWTTLPGRPPRDMVVALNIQHPDYILTRSFYDNELNQIFNGSWTSEKDAKSQLYLSALGACSSNYTSAALNETDCAIFVGNDTGNVEKVDSDRFVNLYENATALERKQMLDMIKDLNLNQIMTKDEQNRKILLTLVEHEQMKKQVNQLENVNEVLEKSNSESFNPLQKFDRLQNNFDGSEASISPSKFASSLANSERQVPTGRPFLTKNLMSGLDGNDYASLTVTGGTLGLMQGIVYGAKNSIPASRAVFKVANAYRFIGKYVHPIGCLIDISLSTKSLVDSVKRYQKTNNVYDKNEAIMDMISSSIDLAAGIGTAVLGIFFPIPAVAINLGIKIAVRALLQPFRARNEVDRINSEVPLLGSEIQEAFWNRVLDIFGMRHRDHFDNLVDEKKANDLAVKIHAEFLKNNTNVRGIVFPSRTMWVSGSCSLIYSYCDAHFFGCVSRWQGYNVIGTGCEYNRPCPFKPCTTWWNKRHWYNCECKGETTPHFGSPRADQFVDLREKTYIHHDRALPSDVDTAEFICKPGTVDYNDERDYRTYQKSTTYGYRCENAIGILQPWYRRDANQYMLFMLENGTDTVYLDTADLTPSVFLIGHSGYKQFHGSGGKNDFQFSGNCNEYLRGNLVGGRSNQDSILVDETCGKGLQLLIDFRSGEMNFLTPNTSLYRDYGPPYSRYQTRTQFKFTFSNIEEINGRRGESDFVMVSCSTKRVVLRGGSRSNPDLVKIDKIVGCKHQLTLLIDNYTTVSSNATHGDITFLIGNQTEGISISTNMSMNSTTNYNIIFLTLASKDFSRFELYHDGNKSSAEVTLTPIPSSNKTVDPISIRFFNTTNPSVPPIYFTEEPNGSPKSVLSFDSKNSKVVYHRLSGIFKKARRTGSPIVKNVMEIMSPDWISVAGGNHDDEFILHWSIREIHGGDGDDVARLHQNLTKAIDLDLTGNHYTSIERIYGSPGKQLNVTVSCTTKLVTALGGNSSIDTLDANVVIPGNQICSHRQLQAVARGSSSITIRSPILDGGIFLYAFAANSSAPQTGEHPLQFKFTTEANDTKGVVLTFYFEHKNWTVESYQKSTVNGGHLIKIQLSGNGIFEERISLNFLVSKESLNEKYVANIPTMRLLQTGGSEPPTRMLVESETGMPVAFFLLDENPITISGYHNISNIFQITNTSWAVTGGNLDDQFHLCASASTNTSLDGCDGTNTLILVDDDEKSNLVMKTFLVNLEKGKFGFLYIPDAEQSTIKNVHNLIGRQNKPEILFANCSTKFINGNGGASTKLTDTIYISGIGCNETNNFQELTLNVPDFTTVKNSAPYGEFTYLVSSFNTSKVKINVTKYNQHRLRYLFHPWHFIEKIAFHAPSETIGFKLLGSKKLYFKMYRSNTTQDYSNPTFQFQGKNPNSVITIIGVDKDGAVAATYLISGNGPSIEANITGLALDANQFLINITEANQEKPGSIMGSNDTSANQFWIFNLNTPLELLDGGACKKCTNYLHLESNFKTGKPILIDLGSDGYIASSKLKLIRSLKNVHVFHGRASQDKDKVVVTCRTESVAEVEEIIILQRNSHQSCNYNLAIEVGPFTTVWFSEDAGNPFRTNDIFNYRFKSPRSFDPDGDPNNLSWLTETNHNYMFPFSLDDLVSMEFDKEEEKLCYLVRNYTNSGPICHSMLKSLTTTDQFYTKPSMVTKDGFRIQINRVGDILLTLGAASSFPSLKVIQSEVIPALEDITKRLDVNIILQTDTEYFNVGHDNVILSRNVLQTAGIVTSHLAGAGQDRSIYEIVSMENDVYIYSGFNGMDGSKSNDAANQQTIILTEVVMDIRMTTRTKFVPKVNAAGNDLVISMTPYENEHPGKIIIVNGIGIFGRMQILLQNTMMYLHFSDERNEWIMKPKPVQIPNGAMYHLAPEDLEDDHEIMFGDENEQDVPTTFTASRNYSDLLISNISDKNETGNDSMQLGRNFTTFIISSFFEEPEDPKPEGNGRVRRSMDIVDRGISFPRSISGIKVNLPGLNLALEGTKVYQVNDTSLEIQNLTEAKLENWKVVLREAEKDLLQDLPPALALPQFQYDDCDDLGICSIVGEVILGVMAVMMLVLILIIILVLQSRNMLPFRNHGYYPSTTVLRENYDDNSKNDEGMELIEYRMEESRTHHQHGTRTGDSLAVQKVVVTTYNVPIQRIPILLDKVDS